MTARLDRSAIPYWDARAPRWRVSQPLAPGPEDVARYAAQAAAEARARARPVTALLLGVTAIIARMEWPRATRLLAVDWSGGMIAHVWPRDLEVAATAVRGDWRMLPVAGASVDFAVGDGCYSTFADLDGPRALNREVHRVLRPGGAFCIRCFTRPERPDAVEALFAQLDAGRHANLDLFRWLLAMAIQGDSRDGVSLRSVWQAWQRHVPDPAAHPARAAWSDDAVANIEGWSRLESRYVFPTLAEVRALAAPLFEVAVEIPGYDWGERFPRLTLRRRA